MLENAREELMKTYKDILNAVKIVPEDAQYRKNVELLTRHRLKVVTEEEDLTRIEERIGMGQVEELHVQAVRELNLIPKMAGTSSLTTTRRLGCALRADAGRTPSISWRACAHVASERPASHSRF